MSNEQELIKYYNKFTEDKRLTSRHGKVEMAVAMYYICAELDGLNDPTLLDVGAGTGAYAVELIKKGVDVTCVELVKYNLGILKSKNGNIKAFQGDARNLKRFKDASFDAVLLFGPMYHLLSFEDKLSALKECKRVLKTGGKLFISYLMADYAIIKHGFMEGSILNEIKAGRLDKNFNIIAKENDLYSYVKLEDIYMLSTAAGLERIKIVGQDGASDYIRPQLNKMTDEEFELYIKYQLSVAERKDLLGASSHILDILKKV